ncbi:MAG TPA: hypothetical protein VF661_17000 [Actinomycetales bacterium]
MVPTSALLLVFLVSCGHDAEPATESRTGPVGDGGAASSCVATYAPSTVGERAFAFDGTVTAIREGTTNRPGGGHLDTSAVTFAVHEWWRGGPVSTVTVDLQLSPGGRTASEEVSPPYGVGTRLLVSGENRWGGEPLDDALAWGCGFTRYHDRATAAAWREAMAPQAAREPPPGSDG